MKFKLLRTISRITYALIVLISCKNENLPALDSSLTSEFFIDSKEKNKTYRIWVLLPEGYKTSSQEYESLYVLDPDDVSVDDNSNFIYISKKCKELSQISRKSNMILIGIRHGDFREVDYTPSKSSTKGFSGQGEGEAFMNFIKKELIPKVEKNYRVARAREQRSIIGHSLGGLCGAYAFTKHNEVFGNYLLLSPSLIYDNEIILQYEQRSRNDIKSRQTMVYLGVGGSEPNMIPPIELLYNRLKTNYSNTIAEFFINPGKGHNSSKDENIKKALECYFTYKKL